MTCHLTRPLARRVFVIVTGVFLALAAWNLSVLIPYVVGQGHAIGVDYRFFVETARQWLDGRALYYPEQLEGSWQIVQNFQFLYPPIALYLFVPFVWLPAILFWLLPIGMILYALLRLQPAVWTWPYLAFVLWYPRTETMFFFGSATLWILGMLALATVHPWAAPLTLLKPSLAPFALFRITSRGWWFGLAAVALLSLPMWELWIDYARAMLNIRDSYLFALQEVPILLAPIVAWAGRTTNPDQSPSYIASRIRQRVALIAKRSARREVQTMWQGPR
jgi:hypothetical protein